MKFESYRRETPNINLSALIDVVFILVIFVVLAASFERMRGVEVDLSDAEAPPMPTQRALTVTVLRTGAIRIGQEAIRQPDLPTKLADLRRAHSALVLYADGAVALERAVEILANAREAGFTRLTIASELPSDAEPGSLLRTR